MMNTAATPLELLTVDEYLAFEETSPVRHEYVGGELYAFAGASDRHNRIVTNIVAQLWMAARGGPCRVYANDMKLRAADDLFYYPDVMVVCDSEDTGEIYKIRPCLVVEVLSPATELVDRREKLLAYRGLESVQAYVVIYRDRMRAVRHWRDDRDTWQLAEITSEGSIPFPCPDLKLSLAEIYEGLDRTTN